MGAATVPSPDAGVIAQGDDEGADERKAVPRCICAKAGNATFGWL